MNSRFFKGSIYNTALQRKCTPELLVGCTTNPTGPHDAVGSYSLVQLKSRLSEVLLACFGLKFRAIQYQSLGTPKCMYTAQTIQSVYTRYPGFLLLLLWRPFFVRSALLESRVIVSGAIHELSSLYPHQQCEVWAAVAGSTPTAAAPPPCSPSTAALAAIQRQKLHHQQQHQEQERLPWPQWSHCCRRDQRDHAAGVKTHARPSTVPVFKIYIQGH